MEDRASLNWERLVRAALQRAAGQAPDGPGGVGRAPSGLSSVVPPSLNWERLVRAALQRAAVQAPGGPGGVGRAPSGLANVVPPSLGKSTNIDLILHVANEVEDENPNVARILCEQAYTMAHELDPSSEGRGVLQFKTGLLLVIKKKLAKKDGAQIDRAHDVEILWNFYKSYKRRNGVDAIQREQERLRESGTFGTTEFELRVLEMKKVYATVRALIMVLEMLAGNSYEGDLGGAIREEIRKRKESDETLKGELMPYNIVPLDAPSLSNAIGFYPERIDGLMEEEEDDDDNSSSVVSLPSDYYSERPPPYLEIEEIPSYRWLESHSFFSRSDPDEISPRKSASSTSPSVASISSHTSKRIKKPSSFRWNWWLSPAVEKKETRTENFLMGWYRL